MRSRSKPTTRNEREIDAVPIEREFQDLVDLWHKETDGHSSPTRIANNPAYQQIISLGTEAVPLILEELQERGGYWYPALREITGEDPVGDFARGRPRLMKEVWLEWGRKHKYL